MSSDPELERLELAESYAHYRWLDDSRFKLMDRFFILVLTVAGARLQFEAQFERTPSMLVLLYVTATATSVLLARSIVTFRRQQRGAAIYIGIMRRRILVSGNVDEFTRYRAFLEAKVWGYASKWAELAVALFAALSPFVLLDPILQRSIFSALASRAASRVSVGVFVFVAAWFILLPLYHYSFRRDDIEWDRH